MPCKYSESKNWTPGSNKY